VEFHTGPLAGYVRLSSAKMQAWFEEDDAFFGHPLDPYKRVDTRRSSRPVRVEVDGVEVARSEWAVHLYETSLPVRYYLPVASLKREYLRESKTTSYCPYKGEAKYWDVVLAGGKGGKDLVWWYPTTPIEVGGIQGLVCFYNEKVDIWLDGVKLERAVSKFA